MGEEKEILLRGKVCAYLTCRLMGDPIDPLPLIGKSCWTQWHFRHLRCLNIHHFEGSAAFVKSTDSPFIKIESAITASGAEMMIESRSRCQSKVFFSPW